MNQDARWDSQWCADEGGGEEAYTAMMSEIAKFYFMKFKNEKGVKSDLDGRILSEPC